MKRDVYTGFSKCLGCGHKRQGMVSKSVWNKNPPKCPKCGKTLQLVSKKEYERVV